MEQILRTKLHRPIPTPEIVPRGRLYDELDMGREKPLTLVSAPAGYGKSVLISSWIQERGLPCAWISLEEADNDLRSFLSYLVEAVHDMNPDVLNEIKSYVEALSLPPIPIIAKGLINGLDALVEECVLVLDDFHVISEGLVHELVDELLRNPPQAVHLVLLSRRDPTLRISRMRVHGRVNEVRMADLRFTREEVSELYERLLKLKIDEETSEELVEATEGWIAGLFLAALTVEQEKDVERALRGMKGGGNLMSEFLVEEVLAKQPADVQECLMQTSILSQFSADLAEALYSAGDEEKGIRLGGQAFIEGVLKANLFVVPLDGEGAWFRYHHLFKNLLQSQLRRKRSPDQIARYHAAASAWYRTHGHIHEAIHHALEARDQELAAQIVEESRYAILDDDKWYVLAKWLEMLPDEIQHERPHLLLAQAWLAWHRVDLRAVPPLIAEVEKICSTQPASESLRGEVELFRGYFLLMQGEAQQAEVPLRNAMTMIPEEHAQMRGAAEVFYALALKMNNKRGEAHQLLNELLYVRRIPKDIRRSRVFAGLCFIGLLEGDLAVVEDVAQEMDTLGRTIQSLYVEMWSVYFRGCVAYLRNDLGEAIRLFTTIAPNRYVVDVRVSADALAALTLAYQLNGEAGKAAETMQLLEDFTSAAKEGTSITVARSTRAHLSLLQGDREAALRSQEPVDPAYDAGAMFVWLEVPRLTRCMVLLAEDSPASVAEAKKNLDQYAESSELRYNDLQMMRVRGLQAIAHQKQSQPEEATAVFTCALEIARRGRIILPFLAFGPEVAELLGTVPTADEDADYVSDIVRAIPNERSAMARAQADPAEESSVGSLSERELDVLTLVRDGLKNDEIAERLLITVGTVKNHLYNIYQKLGVHSRVNALAKARELGLIPMDQSD